MSLRERRPPATYIGQPNQSWTQMGTKMPRNLRRGASPTLCLRISRANFVGTNGHRPSTRECYFFRVSLLTKGRTTFV